MNIPDHIVTRFWTRLDRASAWYGCWLWTGSRNRNGYGSYTIRSGATKRTYRAHRLAWSLANGAIPDGMDICHRCDVRLCCRPDHLFVGTRLANMADMVRKCRQRPHTPSIEERRAAIVPAKAIDRRWARGERINTSRLDADAVRDIRKRYRSGEATGADLARQYGITPPAVLRAAKGITWRHIPDEEGI